MERIADMQAPMIAAMEKKYGPLPPLRRRNPNHPLPPPSEYRPNTEQVSVRMDADVLQWLRGKGKGYQAKLNNLLRTCMEHEQRNGR